LPTGAGGPTNKPVVTVEVIVRDKLLEIGNGKGVVAKIPKVNNAYDFRRLSELLYKIKQNYPDKTDATILLEPNIEYEYMINTMDAVRSMELTPPGQTERVRAELFPDVSIGVAP